jgi:hypothetical protein
MDLKNGNILIRQLERINASGISYAQQPADPPCPEYDAEPGARSCQKLSCTAIKNQPRFTAAKKIINHSQPSVKLLCVLPLSQ